MNLTPRCSNCRASTCRSSARRASWSAKMLNSRVPFLKKSTMRFRRSAEKTVTTSFSTSPATVPSSSWRKAKYNLTEDVLKRLEEEREEREKGR